MHTREIIQTISQYANNRTELVTQYLKFLELIQTEEYKYVFPVVMEVCTLEQSKTMLFNQYCETRNIARLKLEKQLFETLLGFKL